MNLIDSAVLDRILEPRTMVSTDQTLAILDYMKDNPQLAHSRFSRTKEGRNLLKRHWVACADLANNVSTDCAQRTPDQWRAYYNAYKSKLKKKIKDMKTESEVPGGGPVKKRLTDIENRLYSILGPDLGEDLPRVCDTPVSRFETEHQPSSSTAEVMEQDDNISLGSETSDVELYYPEDPSGETSDPVKHTFQLASVVCTEQLKKPVVHLDQRPEPVMHSGQRPESLIYLGQRREPVVHSDQRHAAQRAEPGDHTGQQPESLGHSGQRPEPVNHTGQRPEPVVRSNQQLKPVVHLRQHGEPVILSGQRPGPSMHSSQHLKPVVHSNKRPASVVRSAQQLTPVVHSGQNRDHKIHSERRPGPVVPSRQRSESVGPSRKRPDSVGSSRQRPEPEVLARQQPELMVPSCQQTEPAVPSRQPTESVVPSRQQQEPMMRSEQQQEPMVQSGQFKRETEVEPPLQLHHRPSSELNDGPIPLLEATQALLSMERMKTEAKRDGTAAINRLAGALEAIAERLGGAIIQMSSPPRSRKRCSRISSTESD